MESPSPDEKDEQMRQDVETAQRLSRKHSNYPPLAFLYLLRSLRDMLSQKKEAEHVTGREICLTLRDNLQRDFAFLAPDVACSMGIWETADFGKMVYAMVEEGLFSTSDQDSLADFINVYLIPEAFLLPFRDSPSRRHAAWPVLEQ